MKTFMFALFLLGGLCICVLCAECGAAIGQAAHESYERGLMRLAHDQVMEVLEQRRQEGCARKVAAP